MSIPNDDLLLKASIRLVQLLDERKMPWFLSNYNSPIVATDSLDIEKAKNDYEKAREVETIFNSEQSDFVLDDIASTFTKNEKGMMFFYFKINRVPQREKMTENSKEKKAKARLMELLGEYNLFGVQEEDRSLTVTIDSNRGKKVIIDAFNAKAVEIVFNSEYAQQGLILDDIELTQTRGGKGIALLHFKIIVC